MTSDYPVRLLVCGGRDYADWTRFSDVMAGLPYKIESLCHGGARGADRFAQDYADMEGIPCYAYPADWKTFGKRAGVMRNTEMLHDFQPDIVIAFPGGRGTAHMVKIARAEDIAVLEVDPS